MTLSFFFFDGPDSFFSERQNSGNIFRMFDALRLYLYISFCETDLGPAMPAIWGL